MENSIGRMITLLARRSVISIGNALKKYDLSASEQPFFMALQRYEGLTQEELTALVCVDKAVTARAVSSMEKKGYLVRMQDEKDRRQNRIYPTDKARQIGPKVKEELLRFNKQLTKGLDEQSLEQFYCTLIQIEGNLKKMQNVKEGEE